METYQVNPQEIIHTDIAERYRKSLVEYRRATGQDIHVGRTRSYLQQNSRGLVWLGVGSVVGLATFLFIRSGLRHEASESRENL